MAIDWDMAVKVGMPVVTLFLGIWANRRFEQRPALISYFGHIAAFVHHPTEGAAFKVHTHTIVLRNVGRRPATTVRLHHNSLPDFNIWPQVVHHVETLPDGSKDIVIPALVPGEEITVSYLYFPPLTVAGVNAGIKCDTGFATAHVVLLQRQYPAWFNRLAAALMLIGLIVVIYFLCEGVLVLTR